jgi:putative hemolysin
MLAGNGDVIAIVITIATITYLSLVIGELVPKRIALANPERTAAFVAPAMRVLSRVAAPAVWLLRVSTDLILGLLRLRSVSESTITEDEVKALIAEGTQAGVFAPKEREMIEGVLRLADRSVRLVMTPRTDVQWIDRAASREEILSASAATRHSRILVCDGSIDDPLGFVHAKDLLGVIAGSAPFDLGDMVEPPLAVHERTVVLRLLDLFRRDRVHVALVVDEYGTVQGLVTVTDVLEAIAGDLPEGEEDEEERALVSAREDGSWLIDGMLPIDDFETLVGNPALVQEREFDTVAGLVLDRLGHLPEPGEKLRLPGLTLEVVDMDGRRIDTVLVSRDPVGAASE